MDDERWQALHVRRREELTRSDRLVLEFLESHAGEQLHSKRDIAPGTRFPVGTVGASLTTLVASGFVERLGNGLYTCKKRKRK